MPSSIAQVAEPASLPLRLHLLHLLVHHRVPLRLRAAGAVHAPGLRPPSLPPRDPGTGYFGSTRIYQMVRVRTSGGGIRTRARDSCLRGRNSRPWHSGPV